MTTTRGGRPPVGPMISIRFPVELLDRLDRHAEATGTTRSDLIRRASERLLQEDTMPARYTTIDDAITQAVAPALGEFAHEYDVEAIAREAYAYRVDTDEAGRELLNTAGFEQVVSDEDFWALVEKHTR